MFPFTKGRKQIAGNDAICKMSKNFDDNNDAIGIKLLLFVDVPLILSQMAMPLCYMPLRKPTKQGWLFLLTSEGAHNLLSLSNLWRRYYGRHIYRHSFNAESTVHPTFT